MKKLIANRFKNLLFYALYFKKAFARAFAGAAFLFFFLSLGTIVHGQYETYIFPANPYAQNGCFSSNIPPQVMTVNDHIGVTNTASPPILATFTGGHKVGG